MVVILQYKVQTVIRTVTISGDKYHVIEKWSNGKCISQQVLAI